MRKSISVSEKEFNMYLITFSDGAWVIDEMISHKYVSSGKLKSQLLDIFNREGGLNKRNYSATEYKFDNEEGYKLYLKNKDNIPWSYLEEVECVGL